MACAERNQGRGLDGELNPRFWQDPKRKPTDLGVFAPGSVTLGGSRSGDPLAATPRCPRQAFTPAPTMIARDEIARRMAPPIGANALEDGQWGTSVC